jgi:hypothetical protein
MTRWQHNGNTFVGAGGGAGRAGLVSKQANRAGNVTP